MTRVGEAWDLRPLTYDFYPAGTITLNSMQLAIGQCMPGIFQTEEDFL